MNITYAARETAQNLWRNILLSIATILTISVSLFLVGSLLLTRAAVANATERWEGGIEFVVWMNPDASPEQDASIRNALEESPSVKAITYVDQAQAFEEFSEIFDDNPELVETVTPEDLPPSYRVIPVDPDADVVEELGNQFKGRPGVRQVIFAGDVIKQIQNITAKVVWFFFFGSGLLLLAATLLILSTIAIAINSRGREIEIMKVVGATNWFIRVPFLIEGLVQSLVGAGIAVIGLYLVNAHVINDLTAGNNLQLFNGFKVTPGELRLTSLTIVGISVIVATIGSSVAVTKYLDK